LEVLGLKGDTVDKRDSLERFSRRLGPGSLPATENPHIMPKGCLRRGQACNHRRWAAMRRVHIVHDVKNFHRG
jgi:hypothetical protein